MKKTAAKSPPSVPVQIRVAPELLRQVDELAKKNGIDRSALTSIALTRIVKSGI
jgi:predicted transcriptional regulator